MQYYYFWEIKFTGDSDGSNVTVDNINGNAQKQKHGAHQETEVTCWYELAYVSTTGQRQKAINQHYFLVKMNGSGMAHTIVQSDWMLLLPLA